MPDQIKEVETGDTIEHGTTGSLLRGLGLDDGRRGQGGVGTEGSNKSLHRSEA